MVPGKCFGALFVTLVLLLPALAQAQVGIAGQVKDTSGAAMPGVTVEASSPVLIEKVRTVLTNGQGEYRFIDLTAGVYTVTFTLTGFTTFRRDGLALAGTFTATVDAEMRPGAIEETITVSGATPVVDVHNVLQNQVVTRAVIDALPTGKTFQNYAAIIPGMGITTISRLSAQDVGGSESQGAHLLTIHGSQPNDMQNMIEGLPNNNANSFGYQGIWIDSGSMQEYNYNVGANPAEVQTGGVHVNFIPKDGGNRFTGGVFAAFTNEHLQSDNTTDALRARGVREASRMQRIWDFNPTFGGPIKQDKLWFYLSARTWGQNEIIADAYFNKAHGTLSYVPDLSRPAIDDNWVESASIRPTWQVTPRNKLVGFLSLQSRCLCHNQTSVITPPEVALRAISPNATFMQATWTSTVTPRLLLEAGASRLLFIQTYGPQPEVDPNALGTVELSTGFRYRAPAAMNYTVHGPTYQWKAAASYVTGTHTFKTGFTLQKNRRDLTQTLNGDVTLQLLNGVPSSVVVNTTPFTRSERLFPMLGVFAQDQWQVNNMALSLGLRFDYHNAHVPEQHMGPVRYVGARDFASVPDVPDWRDLSPRLGISYDLFGNGKTALKASVNRYVNGELFSGITSLVNPVNTSVNSTTRSWRDDNGDFIHQESELGPLQNPSFGQVVIRTRFDEEYTKGYGKRLYNWETMAGIQHELLPQVSINASYYRRSYGNFTATDTTGTTPADYDPYCVTVPADPRLPGSGTQLCGFYDVKPAKFAQTADTLFTFADNFGKQTDIYNGVDLTVNGRLPHGARVSGGVNVGREEINVCGVVQGAPDILFAGSAAGIVASRLDPFCDNKPPYQAQLKVQAVYPLPWWGLQTSATLQSLPGPPISATYTVRSVDIAPSLGRNLSAGPNSSVRIDLVPPNTMFDTRLYQTDLRATKHIRVRAVRVQANFDVYNLFNASPVLTVNNNYGPAWLNVLHALPGRLFKFSAQLDF